MKPAGTETGLETKGGQLGATNTQPHSKEGVMTLGVREATTSGAKGAIALVDKILELKDTTSLADRVDTTTR